MKEPALERIPWDAILGANSVALEALTGSGKVRDLVPPGLERLGGIIDARRERFAESGYRERLASALSDGLERRGAPESALRAAADVRRPDAFLVIAGQQAGLLTGPLYTVYKAATAIALAKRLTAERGETFLPAFWCASEDHDYDEVRAVSILDKDHAVAEFTLPDLDRNDRPIYDVPASVCPDGDLDRFLEETLRPTEFTPALLEMVRKTREGSETLSDWTARVLWSLFPDDGLLVIFPEDGFYQRETAGILRAEIESPGRSGQIVRSAAKELEERGLEPQIHKTEDRPAFFLVTGNKGDRRRLALRYEDGRFTAEGGSWSAEDLVRALEDDPISISAGAALRPVCQDAAFPTAANVLGPGELGYHAQIGGIYGLHGVPRPAFSIRLSATILPRRLAERMDASGFTFPEFRKDTEWLVRETVRRSDPSPAGEALDGLRSAVEETFSVLREEAERLDPTIVGAVGKHRASMEKRISQIESLLERRRADREKVLFRHLESIRTHLYPRDRPQERLLNILTFLDLHGADLITQMKGLASGDTSAGHVLIPL